MLSLAGVVAGLFGGDSEVEEKTRVWLDVSQAGVTAGRVVVELEDTACPLLAAHFRRLVEGTETDRVGFPLRYKGSRLHAVYPQSGLIMGGDIRSGKGCDAVAATPDGAAFEPDRRRIHFDKEGTLAAAGMWDGPNRHLANSHFLILTRAMDGGYDDYPDTVPFGRVVEGLSVLKALKGHPVSGTPTHPVIIADCGVFS